MVTHTIHPFIDLFVFNFAATGQGHLINSARCGSLPRSLGFRRGSTGRGAKHQPAGAVASQIGRRVWHVTLPCPIQNIKGSRKCELVLNASGALEAGRRPWLGPLCWGLCLVPTGDHDLRPPFLCGTGEEGFVCNGVIFVTYLTLKRHTGQIGCFTWEGHRRR